jgi:hypothetical protein
MTMIVRESAMDDISFDPGVVTFEEWQAKFFSLEAVAHSLPWWIGDLLLYGEEHFHEQWAQVVSELPWKKDYALQCHYMARMFPKTRRFSELSFSHHVAVVSLPAALQEDLLRRAVLEDWKVREIRQAVRARRLLDVQVKPDMEAIEWFRELPDQCQKLWTKPGTWQEERLIEGKWYRLTITLDEVKEEPISHDEYQDYTTEITVGTVKY